LAKQEALLWAYINDYSQQNSHLRILPARNTPAIATQHGGMRGDDQMQTATIHRANTQPSQAHNLRIRLHFFSSAVCLPALLRQLLQQLLCRRYFLVHAATVVVAALDGQGVAHVQRQRLKLSLAAPLHPAAHPAPHMFQTSQVGQHSQAVRKHNHCN
jgi:hypothetical protein